MDFGIAGRNAVVCASSRGLGKSCAIALAREGANVFINGLDANRLANAAAEIEDLTGYAVTTVQADINTEEGRARLISTCPEADILVNNNAGPPPGSYETLKPEAWQSALAANMLAPIELIQAYVGGMRQRRFGRIVNITSAMVKSPHLPEMGLSVAARTGLTAFCKAISRQIVVDNVTINNLLPERFDTDRQRFMAERMTHELGIGYDEARQRIVDTIAAGRLGQPEELGATCAFICSVHTGYMSGQNIQLDGGSFHGLM